jgi:hypothetical protein
MNTDARRFDAPASGREPTTSLVAPPTPARARASRPLTAARHADAPRAAAVSSRRPAVHLTEVPITILTTGVAR